MQQAHLTIIAVGSDKFDWIESGLAHYETLLKRYAKVSQIIVPSPKKVVTDQSAAQRIEAEKLSPVLQKHQPYVALSDKGTLYDSHSISTWLTKTLVTTGGRLTFVIGGPFGLDPSIIAGAKLTMSLSPLTYSHQLVRLVLLEQLFRAFSISAGDSYHR